MYELSPELKQELIEKRDCWFKHQQDYYNALIEGNFEEAFKHAIASSNEWSPALMTAIAEGISAMDKDSYARTCNDFEARLESAIIDGE